MTIWQVEALDEVQGTCFARRLHTGLRDALSGDPTGLVAVADAVLSLVGGRLWDGFYMPAAIPGSAVESR